MNLQITTLNPSELIEFWPVFREVIQTQFPGYSKEVISYLINKIYHRYAFEYWIRNNEKIVFSAKYNTIVGFAVIDRPYGGVSFCRWLGVLPEHQHKGIGRKLIDKWTAIAHDQGCHKIEVASQPEARDFYAKAGLTLEGKREKSYFGIDQYIFGKVIGEPQDEVMIK